MEAKAREESVPTVCIENDGAVVRVVLNRPNEGNLLTNEMVAVVKDAVYGIGRDTKAIVLTARGADFSLGRDIAALKLSGPKPEALKLRAQNEIIFDCYGALRNVAVPVISIVRGRAHGFGCALAAMADITICATNSTFTLPEMGHGIVPGMAMSALVDRIPKKALMHLVYSTSVISAAQAREIGLVNEVAEPEQIDARTKELVAAVTRMTLPALKAVKEYVHTAYGLNTHAATNFARNLHATVNSSEETRMPKDH